VPVVRQLLTGIIILFHDIVIALRTTVDPYGPPVAPRGSHVRGPSHCAECTGFTVSPDRSETFLTALQNAFRR
jgi:hypothetical protein